MYLRTRGACFAALLGRRERRGEKLPRVHATNATQATSLHLGPFLSFPFVSLVVMYFLSFSSPSKLSFVF
ncbi:unnamed protein product [Sphagnum jensenii]